MLLFENDLNKSYDEYMKKLYILLMLAVLPFFLTACDKKDEDKKTITADKTQDNVFTSIRDAMSKSIVLRCEYLDEDGETTIAHIKGKVIALEAAKPDADGKIIKGIAMDEKLYFWADGAEKGTYFNILDPEDKEDEGTSMQGDKVQNIDDIINKLEANKEKCSNAQVPASMFELPQGVEFEEWSW